MVKIQFSYNMLRIRDLYSVKYFKTIQNNILLRQKILYFNVYTLKLLFVHIKLILNILKVTEEYPPNEYN